MYMKCELGCLKQAFIILQKGKAGKMYKLENWQKNAETLDSYFCCEAVRGREYVLRLTTGADPVLAIAKFAHDNGIKYGKVHAPFMGAFSTTKYLMWAPNTEEPKNWHTEVIATCDHVCSICALGGMIGIRPKKLGGEESFVAMHFVAGASWETAIFGGHLEVGTRVAGTFQLFVTELLNIEALKPVDLYNEEFTWPQNWYKNIKEL